MKNGNLTISDKAIFFLYSIAYIFIQSYCMRSFLGSSLFFWITLASLFVYTFLLWINEVIVRKENFLKNKKDAFIYVAIFMFNYGCIYFVFNHHSQYELFTTVFSVVECILHCLSFFIFYSLFIWKTDLRKLFMISMVTLGSVMMLCMPIGAIPDEPQHIRCTYSVSNIIMHKNTVREDDYLVNDHDYWAGSYQDVNQYDKYLQEVVEPLHSTKEVAVSMHDATISDYVYIIPALAISAGRLLELGTGLTYMLGRIANFVVFCLIINKAIKITPVGKVSLFTYCLLPMTLHQAISISYDSLLFALSAYSICLSIRILYDGKSVIESKFSKYFIISIIVFLVTFGIKHHAYMLIGFLPLCMMILVKHEDKIRNNLKKIRRAAYLLLFILISAYCVFYFSGFAVKMYHPTMIDQFGTIPPEESYSLSFLLAFPIASIKMLGRSLIISTQWNIETMIGRQLGWLNLMMPQMLIIIYILLLIFSGIRRISEDVSSIRFKKIYGGAAILTIAFAMVGMAMSWTPISSEIIQGVQGRYFVPIILILLFLEKRLPIVITAQNDNEFMIILMVIATYTIQYLLIRL